MSFEPVIGHTYYLYEKESGEKVLSMVGPHEWGKSFPFNEYLCTVKMLGDHTWEITDDPAHQGKE
jgi:hypothetical protein